ncbi:YggT family protein [Holophaga foetida]|uniref:YggT family protein n=1 Tax=Holophaga foetida TaxID=35839 RepID=UPI0002471C3E|nr:YggT family protein [Holophaga foetida]
MPLIVLIVLYLIKALVLLIFISSVLSWFHPDPRNPFVKLVRTVVDPLVHPIQRIIPPFGGMDFSPLIAFVILLLLQSLLQKGFTH